FEVNGTLLKSALTLAGGGVLAGVGAVGTVTGTGGTIAPGSGGPGVLTTKDVSFGAGGGLAIDLNGTAPGQFDQLKVTGTVNLAGATLSPTLGYAPAVGDTFTIIDNDLGELVGNTFTGLPDGATFSAGGRTFRINYNGGDGNDVVLTVA